MKDLKLLLVYPAVRFENRLRYFMTDFSCAEAPGAFVFPPLELLYVASLVRKNNINMKLIDAARKKKPPEWTIKQCIEESPTHILFPVPIGELFFSVFEIINAVYEKLPHVKLAVFGPEVTLDPSLAFKYESIDAVIIGEPDKPTPDWVQGKETPNNLIFRNDPKPPQLTPFTDLDTLPHPARDLLDPKRYYAPFSRSGPYTTVWGSRGCAHGKCLFCPSSLWRPAKTYIHHSPEYIIEELQQAINIGYKEVFFRDQTFTSNKAWVEQICKKILKQQIKIFWRCMTRADCADYQLFKLMKKAGCYQISIGFESPEQEVLDKNIKGIKVDESFRAAEMVKKAGLELVGNFLIGLKGESKDGINQISDFAKQLKCDFAQFHAVLPIPHQNAANIFPSVSEAQKKIIASAQRNAYLRFYLTPGFFYKRLPMLFDLKMLIATKEAAWNVIKYGM